MPDLAVRSARIAAVALLSGALLALFALQQATALNLLSDSFVLLSARPLGMGGAACALPQAASIFYNPAGLASVRRLSAMHNHSGRHFPGSHAGKGSEWDQLDGDTQVLTVPLPLGTYAHGFTLGGEMGYDFRNLPLPGTGSGDPKVDFTAACGYPREQYWGSESYDAYAVGSWLPLSGGIANRRHFSRFTPDQNDPSGLSWFRFGEGQQWGLLARLLPGFNYGLSELKIDYNFVNLPTPGRPSAATATGAPDFSQREKLRRSGWAFQPCGWLVWAQDQASESHRFVPENGALLPGLKDATAERSYRGLELALGGLGVLRQGNFDGHTTSGFTLNLFGLSGGPAINYAEAVGLLPFLTGAGQGFEDIHIYGFEVPLT